MKPLAIHRSSFLLGLAFAGLGALVAAQTVLPASPPRIEYGPHPRDMVQIAQGTPYVVPTGKLFVLTALGDALNVGYATFAVDGVTQASVNLGCSSGGGPSVAAVPPGLTVPAGATITAFTNSGGAQGRAWGYLANSN